MMQIHVASLPDIPEMHRIRMSVRENQLTNPALVQPHHYRAMLNEQGRGWLAKIKGRVVGFAVVDLTRSNVWALFVDPGFEGRGVGRRLHDTMTDWLFAEGAEHVWLSTDQVTRAARFYQSAGWRYAGNEPNGEVRYGMSREHWLAPKA
jgi:GNAT superfamily N-acetyltransferase